MWTGLESRLGNRLKGSHTVTPWIIEHAAEVLSKFVVGTDGLTLDERWKGNNLTKEMVEFGEKVHYKLNSKAKPEGEKLEKKVA